MIKGYIKEVVNLTLYHDKLIKQTYIIKYKKENEDEKKIDCINDGAGNGAQLGAYDRMRRQR